MPMTDESVQETLSAAIAIIASEVETARPYNNLLFTSRIELLLGSITYIRDASKSSNGIPACRGLGLENALAVSEKIIAGEHEWWNLNLATGSLMRSYSM